MRFLLLGISKLVYNYNIQLGNSEATNLNRIKLYVAGEIQYPQLLHLMSERYTKEDDVYHLSAEQNNQKTLSNLIQYQSILAN